MTDQQSNRVQLEALAGLFAADAGTAIVLNGVTQILRLMVPKPSEAVIRALAIMVSAGNLPDDLGVPQGPAQAIETELAGAWLASYVGAALERLTEANPDTLDAEAWDKERRYFDLHRDAEERRMRSAAHQDMTAKLNSDRPDFARVGEEEVQLLNWHSVIDARTTPECRWAHGQNFRADQQPIIGWPGSVHLSCRCTAGPAIPGAPLMPSA